MANRNVHLLDASQRSDAFEKEVQKLLSQENPTEAVLGLERHLGIENEGGRGQETIPSVLRRWRNDNRVNANYKKETKNVLKRLAIFKTHKVPLFIDDFGDKNLLSSYYRTEEVVIEPEDSIYHVTHLKEAVSIACTKELKASDEKNIMEGCWFGIDLKPEKPESVYGSRYFETTLSKLGVGGLRQGEIVYYKREVNVILYADNEGDANGVKKPTEATARRLHKNSNMYVKVSIFVPKRFLPKPDNFDQVISGPFKAEHGDMCVRGLRFFKCRPDKDHCFELSCDKWMKDVRREEHPATIIERIKLYSKETLEGKFRGFFNLFAESCIPGPLMEEELSKHLKDSFAYRRYLIDAFEDSFAYRRNPFDASEASFAYRRNPFDASERGFTTWRRASGAQAVAERDDDNVGYKALIKAFRRKEDAATIIQMIKSWSGPKLEERIRAFFNLLAESCLPDSPLSERDLFNHLAASLEYRRQLIEAFERGFTIWKEASGAQAVAERDDDNVPFERLAALTLEDHPATTIKTIKK
ncbi:uncharacterized protein [Acropora muricata]|uniref:uncharacterized protein isoform X2 n=1 Tax=Acropora muricata TaxID=159855 RepID=UPI0034E587B0